MFFAFAFKDFASIYASFGLFSEIKRLRFARVFMVFMAFCYLHCLWFVDILTSGLCLFMQTRSPQTNVSLKKKKYRKAVAQIVGLHLKKKKKNSFFG